MKTGIGQLDRRTKDSRLKRIIASRDIQKQISESERDGEKPVVLAVYGGDNFLGYKVDSCWTLIPEGFKIHPLRDAGPEAHLARNLLSHFNGSLEGGVRYEKSWFPKFDSVRVVVLGLSQQNLGQPLLEYRIEKTNGKYEIIK